MHACEELYLCLIYKICFVGFAGLFFGPQICWRETNTKPQLYLILYLSLKKSIKNLIFLLYFLYHWYTLLSVSKIVSQKHARTRNFTARTAIAVETYPDILQKFKEKKKDFNIKQRMKTKIYIKMKHSHFQNPKWNNTKTIGASCYVGWRTTKIFFQELESSSPDWTQNHNVNSLAQDYMEERERINGIEAFFF